MSKKVDPVEVREAMAAVAGWLRGDSLDDGASPARPDRATMARAVRLSARMVAQEAPGHSVELRVPPFAAVQCIEGPRHTRGTPPNVVEVEPELWLRLALGMVGFEEARRTAGRAMDVSGTRAGELAGVLPVVRLE
ncbi:sterol carrier family protein [uncultured Corynebacterium sp.]|uniref:sterol carrier family protein n=1 Tax=uncultured Corynebacterium sp. TaxID=159447 RepID=UPI0025F2884D|nr:sterol carrier family protein [uncultured Corynebacterium sp.]